MKLYLFEFVSKCKLTPSWFVSSLLGKKLATSGLGGRLGLEGEELELWVELMRASAKVEPNSEECIYWFLEFPFFYIVRPLDAILRRHCGEVPIRLFYGDNDWMYGLSGRKFLAEIEGEQLGIKTALIRDCGHQMTFENPGAILARLGTDWR